MPTYSYKCTECENAFDVQQAFTDDSLTTCPVCGGTLRKVFNSIGVTFNGSGFYRTDSRAGKGGAGKESAGKGGSGKESAGKGGSGKESAGAKTGSSPASPSAK